MFKYLAGIALFAIVYANNIKEWKIQTAEDLAAHRTECVAAHNISEDMVTEFKKWNFTDNEKTHEYIKCIFTKMGLFDENSGWNVDHLVEQLGQNRNKDETRTEVLKCADKNEAKDNAATWAFRGLKCFKAAHLSLIQASVKKPE